MTLSNLVDCLSFNQDIEVFISDPMSGYLSNRQYYGRKSGIERDYRFSLLPLEVDSIELCHYSDRESTIRITVFTNQW